MSKPRGQPWDLLWACAGQLIYGVLDVDFSYCWINLVVSWVFSEQYIGFVVRHACLTTKPMYCSREYQLTTRLYMEFFEDRAPINSSEPPRWWKRVWMTHLSFWSKIERRVPAAHKLCGPSHTICHRGTETRWFHALLGHFGHPSGRWNTNTRVYRKPTIQINIYNGIAITIWLAR